MQLVLLIQVLILSLGVSAQDTLSYSKGNYRVVREVLKSVESNCLKEKSDLVAVELITQAKNASIAAREYLTSLPEYSIAVKETLENEDALKDFKKKVKTEDETYIALADKARDAQKEKRDHLIKTSPPYADAWTWTKNYRIWKSNRATK